MRVEVDAKWRVSSMRGVQLLGRKGANYKSCIQGVKVLVVCSVLFSESLILDKAVVVAIGHPEVALQITGNS